MFALLKGRKTYVTGALAVLTAIGSVLTGDMAIAEGVQLVVTAVLGMTIRNGMK